MAVFSFYLFAIVAVVSGVLVIFARNPVHSVLWLILAFFSAAGLFVLLGAEFVAMLLVIVYVKHHPTRLSTIYFCARNTTL